MIIEAGHLIDLKFFAGLIVFILLIGGVVWTVQQNNPVEWWHFIATKARDGSERGDIDKLGKVVGIAVASWSVMVLAYSNHLDPFLFLSYLAFVGGVAGYSAYLRSKGDIRERDKHD